MRNFTVKQLVMLNIAMLAICTATLVVSIWGVAIATAALAAPVEEAYIEVQTEGPVQEPEVLPEPEPEPDPYRADIPLSRELQEVLREACAENGIPFEVGVGLIDVESDFDPTAVSASGCYGLCQLNPRYFPAGLSDEENIRTGIGYLGEQLKRYDGDMEAALQSYHDGHDTGKRWYAAKVLSDAEYWRDEK